MNKKIENKNMGKANHGWLNTSYHFSFADYYNPDNIDFGVLRVLNDDIIQPKTGFDMHPHKNMEIITYVIDGELTHKDSNGNVNVNTISRGDLQYMSAGCSIFHSEHNLGEVPLRLLQIWIRPDKPNLKSQYGDLSLPWSKRNNKWLKMISAKNEKDTEISINQDASILVSWLEKDHPLEFKLSENKQAYIVQIEGKSLINKIELNQRDAMEIIGENVNIKAIEDSHFLLIEMKK